MTLFSQSVTITIITTILVLVSLWILFEIWRAPHYKQEIDGTYKEVKPMKKISDLFKKK